MLTVDSSLISCNSTSLLHTEAQWLHPCIEIWLLMGHNIMINNGIEKEKENIRLSSCRWPYIPHKRMQQKLDILESCWSLYVELAHKFHWTKSEKLNISVKWFFKFENEFGRRRILMQPWACRQCYKQKYQALELQISNHPIGSSPANQWTDNGFHYKCNCLDYKVALLWVLHERHRMGLLDKSFICLNLLVEEIEIINQIELESHDKKHIIW